MVSWSRRIADGGFDPLWSYACFDPATMTMGAGLAATMAGSAISAGGTLTSGDYAAAAGKAQKGASEFEAKQIDMNATGEENVAAVQAGERRLATRSAINTSRATAAASGVDASTGSPADNEGALAQRGEYQALMDIWSGKNAATGLQNKATAVRYGGDLAEWEGKVKKDSSRVAALGTLASGAGSTLSQAGKVFFPTARGSFGA